VGGSPPATAGESTMTVSMERAWEIAKEVEITRHILACSFRMTRKELLCDCNVLRKHPEYLEGKLRAEKAEKADLLKRMTGG